MTLLNSRATLPLYPLVARGLLLYALLATSHAGTAQTLAHRKPSAANSPATKGTNARQALPAEAEGEYRWGEPGEVIQLYVEEGALQGYLTRRSERGDAASAPLTFTFAEASTSDGLLHFRTRQIHGDWYAFSGRVVRGVAASPHVEGYYLLNGTLETHFNGLAGSVARADSSGPAAPPASSPASTANTSAGNDSFSRQVSLKLAADTR